MSLAVAPAPPDAMRLAFSCSSRTDAASISAFLAARACAWRSLYIQNASRPATAAGGERIQGESRASDERVAGERAGAAQRVSARARHAPKAMRMAKETTTPDVEPTGVAAQFTW
jgi:hypothetical protein